MNNRRDMFKKYIIALAFSFPFALPTFAQNEKSEDEIPEPTVETLVTSDGVRLKCDYYPGVNGKETVPVIMLHDWESDSRPLLATAAFLQKELGCAVIVPDLRGHGRSKTVEGGGDDIDFDEFKRVQIESIANDIEACKKFLMKQNNEGLLNIEMLTVVASHRTCIQASMWAVSDWDWPTLADGTKQGQDVKMLVMVSPIRRAKGLAMNNVLKAPILSGKGLDQALITCLLWGSGDSTTDREARAIYNTLVKNRADLSDLNAEEKIKKQDLFRNAYRNVSFVGDRLIENNPGGNSTLHDNLAKLINLKLISVKDDLRWQDRSSK